MNPTKRVIVNTSAQYVKAIFNICFALYATRVVLEALQVDDYGIYNAVGGVIGMFGYLTNTLVITTQRYISFYQGVGDLSYVKKIFGNSLFIHLVIAASLLLLLLLLQNYLIYEFLVISPDRLDAASTVFRLTVIMLFITILTSPFKALLISHENIVYISIVEITDGLIKLLLAISLSYITFDKLEFYAYGMTIVIILNLIAFAAFSFYRYPECHIGFSTQLLERQCIKKLLGFAGWTTYGTLAGMCQTQGATVLLNHFFGTAINAAFGLASQISSAIRFVSTSVLNAMNPQIIKAEGSEDRKKMLELACKESKFSTALMIIVGIPVLVEIPNILGWWLKTIPTGTVLFCRAIILAFLIDQLSIGLHTANQATGKIRIYSLLMFTPKILFIPISWLMLDNGFTPSNMMTLFVVIELLVALARIPFMKYTAGLSTKYYIKSVLIPLAPLCIIAWGTSWTISSFINLQNRFFLTLILSALISVGALYVFTLSKDERGYILNHIKLYCSHENRFE